MDDKKTHPTLPSTLYTEDYFLTACEGHLEFVDSQGEQLSSRLATAFDLADVHAGMAVLDVGCGRGEILRHCAERGADAFGVDYAAVAVGLSHDLVTGTGSMPGRLGVAQADAKHLPFTGNAFDRVLMLDVVEHLYPWELQTALREIRRVLKPEGRLVVHTAPNRWYLLYGYPLVRALRHLMGQGGDYPRDPRAFGVAVNQDVHVNEQDMLSLRRALRRAGFRGRVWLDTPPQERDESGLLAFLRHIAFEWPPFRWFFEREVFAVASKA